MRKFSYVFRELVADDKDFIGLIAYTVYKKQKIAYLDGYNKKHQQYPTDLEFEQYHDFMSSAEQLQHYRNTAQQEVDQLVGLLLTDKAEEIEAFYRDGFRIPVQEIKNHIDNQSNKHGFFYGVRQSLVASVLWIVGLALLFFLSRAKDIGVVAVVEQVFHVKIIALPDTVKSTR